MGAELLPLRGAARELRLTGRELDASSRRYCRLQRWHRSSRRTACRTRGRGGRHAGGPGFRRGRAPGPARPPARLGAARRASLAALARLAGDAGAGRRVSRLGAWSTARKADLDRAAVAALADLAGVAAGAADGAAIEVGAAGLPVAPAHPARCRRPRPGGLARRARSPRRRQPDRPALVPGAPRSSGWRCAGGGPGAGAFAKLTGRCRRRGRRLFPGLTTSRDLGGSDVVVYAASRCPDVDAHASSAPSPRSDTLGDRSTPADRSARRHRE